MQSVSPAGTNPANGTQSESFATPGVIRFGQPELRPVYFDWAPGIARFLNLPPSWQNEPPQSRLVAFVSASSGRLLAHAQERASSPVSYAGHLQPVRSPYSGLPAATIPQDFPMGRTRYRDLQGVERQPTGHISETETVWGSLQFLARIQALPVPPEGDLPSKAYFKLSGHAGQAEGPASGPQPEFSFQQNELDEGMLANFLAFMDSSATFRKVVRYAALTGQKQYTVTIVGPMADGPADTALYRVVGVDKRKSEIIVPLRDARPIGNQYYLFNGNVLMPLSAVCFTLRSFMTALLPAGNWEYSPWLTEGSQGIDPQSIVDQGVAERGVLDYMTQRILKELRFRGYRWLSPLPFLDGVPVKLPGVATLVARPSADIQAALDAIGGTKIVEAYVEWQDRYLEQQYPLG